MSLLSDTDRCRTAPVVAGTTDPTAKGPPVSDTARTIHLWDELDIEVSVLDEARHRPRHPLTAGSAPHDRAPGIYLLFYAGALRSYRQVSDGSYPVYVGAAADLAERIARHRRNTRPVRNLRGGRDLTVISVPLESHPAALYLEGLIDRRLRPCWNQPWLAGFGSRFQGTSRTGQLEPAWSVLHPGRRVASGPATAQPHEVRSLLVQHLRATVRAGLFLEP
jgi:hypothetical protein